MQGEFGKIIAKGWFSGCGGNHTQLCIALAWQVRNGYLEHFVVILIIKERLAGDRFWEPAGFNVNIA